MPIKLLRNHLTAVTIDHHAERETKILPLILEHADALLEKLVSARPNLQDQLRDQTFYLLPIGVRSIKEERLAELLLSDSLPSDDWELTQDEQNHLLRPFLFFISENTIHDWDAHRHVKNKQFYLQTATAYGIAKLVPYSELIDVLTELVDSLEIAKPTGRTLSASDITLFEGTHTNAQRLLPAHVDRVYRMLRGGLHSLYRIEDPGDCEKAYREFHLPFLARDESVLTDQERKDLLSTLAAVYHVGRYRRAGFHARTRLPWLHHEPGTSILLKKLREDLIEDFRTESLGTVSFAVPAAMPIADIEDFRTESPGTVVAGPSKERSAYTPTQTYRRLRLYYLFRDCARAMASGAANWPARVADGRVRKILLIDDNYRSDVNWRLDVIRRELWAGEVEIDVAAPSVWAEFSTWFETNWASQVRTWELDKEHLQVSAMPSYPPSGTATPCPKRELKLAEYDLILLDAEVEGRDRGPELVFWLDQLAKMQARAARIAEAAGGGRSGSMRSTEVELSHRIIVLTDARPTENLQQSFNLGVENYIFKDRIFDLPFAITQVHEVKELRKHKGHTRDYRAVHQLPLRALSSLRSAHPSRLVTGKASKYLDRRWIKRLPKADLHYHIGTSISLESIAAMALNTTGYLLNHVEIGGKSDGDFEPSELKKTITRMVRLVLKTVAADRNTPIQREFWRSACGEFPEEMKRTGNAAGDPPDADIYGKVIEAVTGEGVIKQFEYASLLVATIAVVETSCYQPEVSLLTQSSERWRWISQLDEHVEPAAEGVADANPTPELGRRLRRTIMSAVSDWTGVYLQNQVVETFAGLTTNTGKWSSLTDRVLARAERATSEILSAVKDCLAAEPELKAKLNKDLMRGRHSLLHRFVTASPQTGESAERGLLETKSLLKYLWGSSLLGADHLQFPENILLAAMDIVKQNVDDNIWYSELRCATNGYCQAGLRPLAATELLCRSFDVASAHWAAAYNNRWVLVNILLGAKRHKAKEIPEVIRLLSTYLQRNRTQDVDRPELRGNSPSWWSLSRVVGFDLSGNESRIGRSVLTTEDLRRDMKPLLEDCAQITIHAGEASTAENIWDAIYLLGARRIGHGLRLREHQRLLDHAITQGICLELCPISNSLTNDFTTNVRRANSDEEGHGGAGSESGPQAIYDANSRWHYPLGGYLDKNVHVCINTDNRFLHDEHTLTDEYLKAAQLVGGLTRLEILRLMRAGFATAFLEPARKSDLIGSVEEAVYRILCEHDEENYGPNGS